jgi:hypothetical protein
MHIFQLFSSHYMQTKGQTKSEANRHIFATCHFQHAENVFKDIKNYTVKTLPLHDEELF